MALNLRGRNFLKLLDFSSEEIKYLIDLSKELKTLKRCKIAHDKLKGKNIVLLFEKTSTRTRCSFEVAGHDLGLGVTFLDSKNSQMGKKESIKDTARVLSRMYDGIEYRGFKQETVEELAKYSDVPVWNGLTDEFHPTQMIADLLTIEEKKGNLKGINLVYMGDARYNMGNSLMVACAKMGMNFTACAPKELFPSKELVDECKEIAKETGGSITLTENVKEGTKNADVIYTDIWVSMGEPAKVWDERIKILKPYQVNSEVMKNAKEDAIFMHCLPSYHDAETEIGKEVIEKYNLENGVEVTNEVFEGKQSVVFDEAENRMHSIKAIIMATIGA
ncbi:MAG: ornithine carbamoyltransferase [Clostridium sp.]|jgi:ornithine carbamoyltransferase|nr:ornithine carbamoyltransferase [Clostridium sp.]